MTNLNDAVDSAMSDADQELSDEAAEQTGNTAPSRADKSRKTKPAKKAKKAKTAKAKKTDKPKRVKIEKPPYQIVTGIVKDKKYHLTKETFESIDALEKAVIRHMKANGYQTGLREVMVSFKRPVTK